MGVKGWIGSSGLWGPRASTVGCLSWGVVSQLLLWPVLIPYRSNACQHWLREKLAGRHWFSCDPQPKIEYSGGTDFVSHSCHFISWSLSFTLKNGGEAINKHLHKWDYGDRMNICHLFQSGWYVLSETVLDLYDFGLVGQCQLRMVDMSASLEVFSWSWHPYKVFLQLSSGILCISRCILNSVWVTPNTYIWQLHWVLWNSLGLLFLKLWSHVSSGYFCISSLSHAICFPVLASYVCWSGSCLIIFYTIVK